MRPLIAALFLCLSGAAHAESCVASVYGTNDRDQNGTRTASGIPLNDKVATIARPARRYLRTFATVTNRRTGRSARFLTTDLGPFKAGRCVDLSHQAALDIGCPVNGLCRVTVQ